MQTFADAMQAFEPALPLGVAYSGGADSTALLVACASKWPGNVCAIHVNHGLQVASAAFEQHCRSRCDSLRVPLHVVHVDATASPGQSPEEAARSARYRALERLSTVEICGGYRIRSIAIAHHADDQVETMLLALSRGSGLPGLSGMGMHWQRSGMAFYRPLLGVPGHALRSQLDSNAEPYIVDPTNSDTRFTRNRLRARVMPVLQDVFPQCTATFSRTARLVAEAQVILDEVALDDWTRVEGKETGLPVIAQLQRLSPARLANLLRLWLKREYAVVPSVAQMRELQKQIQACVTRGHKIRIRVANGYVERRGRFLQWYLQDV